MLQDRERREVLTGVFDERGIGLQRCRERSVLIAYNELERRKGQYHTFAWACHVCQ